MAALEGKLLADFSDFTRAVDGAVVSLKSFESGAGQVDKSLSRMVDNFSGRKVVQDATLMAEAVEKIGGSSKLTDAELQKVGATAEAAAFKLRAMGQAVPPQIQALADDFKKLDESTKTASTSFTTLVGSFVSAQAIIAGAEKAFDAIVGLVKEMGQLALEGAAVSDVTGNFEHLTEQAGRLGDTLLGALRTGTHNTIADFDLMKVANKDLAAGMTLTDAQFATLAKGAFALAQATGTDVKQGLEVMNDAMLTGRGRALALLTGKIDLKAAEEAYATTLGTTADRLTEDEKLYADRHAMLDAVTAATARLGEQTDGLDEHVAQANTSWENFRLSLGKTIAESKTLEAGFTTLRTALIEAFGGNQQALIDAIAQAVDQAAIVVVDFALAAIEGARDFNVAWSLVKTVVLAVETGLVTMAAAATEAYARIAKGATYLPGATDETRRMAAEARSAADSMWNLSKALDEETKQAFAGVTGHSEFDQTLDKLGGVLLQTRDAMVTASAATTTQTAVTTGATAAAREGTTATLEYASATGVAARAKQDAIAVQKELTRFEGESHKLFLEHWKEEEAAKTKQTATMNATVLAGLNDTQKAEAALHDFQMKQTLDETSYRVLKTWEAADAQVAAFKGTAEQAAHYAEVVYGLAAEMSAKIEDDAYGHMHDLGDKLLVDVVAVANKIKGVVEETVNQTRQAAAQLQTLQGGIKLPGSREEQAFGQTYIVGPNGQRVALGPHGELPDNFFQQYSGQSSFSSGISNQPRIGSGFEARAEGGTVSSGTPYLVGERGPELFVPSASGAIVPNGGGAGVTQNVVIHVNGTAADVARQVASELMRTLRAGQQLPLR